jgi:cytidylate kinase
VRDFVERLLSLPAVAERGELAYADPGFARLYLEASRGAALRDHSALDELVARALPDGERLQRARVLDVGCGDGRWAARLVEKGARAVVGVEAAPPMAAAARARNLERFTLLEASITACELEGEFDAILASMSLDHVAELGPVLRRLCAHLAPRGRLVVTTEHPLRTAPRSGARWLDEGGARAARVQDYGVEDWRTFYWFDHPAPVRVYHRTVEGWVRAIREAGLELVALHEPVTPGERDGGVPRFWMLVVEKAGPRAPLITVDGAAATGKSSFGEALALRLGWRPVDSGRLQRAFAWRHLRGSRESIRHEMRPGGGRYLVGSRDVTEELDTEEVARACAELGAAAQRELSELLERLTAQPCVVMGRAMGRLYPAPLARFFLAASLETRAARRGCRPDILEERDRRDAERGRLLLPDIDSVYLETDSLAVGELVERALGAIQGRLAEMEGRPELRGPRAS